MRARAGTGWQYLMTDLSLILFMITAAALREAPASVPASAAVPAEGEPVALWREGPGSPGLAAWLADNGTDPRLRLTIYAAPAEADLAMALAQQGGRPARIVLDPGLSGPAFAALAFDRGMARPLQP